MHTEEVINRLGRACLSKWSFKFIEDPAYKETRGAIWIERPEDTSKWRAYKAHGDNWLEECLDEAGVPK